LNIKKTLLKSSGVVGFYSFIKGFEAIESLRSGLEPFFVVL
jgi:hypothetical protein